MPSPSFELIRPSDRGRSTGPGSASVGVPLRPREWQSRLIQLLRARLVQAEERGRDVLLHAGPGAGKTLGALLGFQRLHREGRLDRFAVFCHRTSIARQWRAAAERLGMTLGEWDPQDSPHPEHQGLLLSYQAAARHGDRLTAVLERWCGQEGWMAIADEVHHLGLDPEEPEATAWGHAFSRLSRSADLRLGLSGTPFRADNLAFCAARRLRVEERGVICERIVPDLCVEPRRLILAGDVRPLEFRFQDGWVEHGRLRPGEERPLRRGEDGETSPLSAEQRESWRARNLRRAIRLGDPGGIAQRVLLEARRRLERVRQGHPRAGGLVIARAIGHAHRIASQLSEEGETALLVHSGDPAAAARLEAFRAGEADWLVSVDMCAEGFDAPRLRVVAYLTTVVTRSRFLQAITRAVRVDDTRAAVEPVPRLPSYVCAPADPLLLAHARTWSLSEPYLIRPRPRTAAAPVAAEAGGRLPLQALADAPGEIIRLGGPELPPFLGRPPGFGR